MKLFYFTRMDGVENFGDSLNPWLWDKFIAEELDDREVTAFVGIGTILNGELPYRLPNARNFVVFSSGVGYGLGNIPAIDHRWKIYCVRGPLSARQLGTPENMAIADGGLLIRRAYTDTASKEYPYSFMPHVQQAIEQSAFWSQICERAGIHYLDPRRPIQDILNLLNKTEVLLTEAMHGAITAEALRVPWIPIRTNSEVLTFKWVDWCSSVGLEYVPIYIPMQNGEIEQEKIAYRLAKIIQTAKPLLASDQLIESLTTQLEEKLDMFKADVKSHNVFKT
jgi:succinoglycan biosynthesis protein ExoV